MHNDLINLLPPERQRMLGRQYVVRLSVLIVLFVTILTGVSILLLVPTYVFLTQGIQVKESQLANIQSALSSTNESSLSARIAALNADGTILTALAQVPAASIVLRSVLAIAHPDITLSNFSYTPPIAAGDTGTLLISGTAATRNALSNYQLALQSAPFISSADLPVSAYASDSNISFTITVTLAP